MTTTTATLTELETRVLELLRNESEGGGTVDADGTEWRSVYLDNVEWPGNRKSLDGVLGSLTVKGLYQGQDGYFGLVNVGKPEAAAVDPTKAEEIQLLADLIGRCPRGGYLAQILGSLQGQIESAIRNDFVCVTRDVRDLEAVAATLAARVRTLEAEVATLERKRDDAQRSAGRMAAAALVAAESLETAAFNARKAAQVLA